MCLDSYKLTKDVVDWQSTKSPTIVSAHSFIYRNPAQFPWSLSLCGFFYAKCLDNNWSATSWTLGPANIILVMCVFSPKEKDDGCLSLNLSDVHSTISFSNLIMGVILPLRSCSILFSSERRLMFCLDFTSLHVPRGSNRISIHSIFWFDFLFHSFLVHLAGLSSGAALARTQHIEFWS